MQFSGSILVEMEGDLAKVHWISKVPTPLPFKTEGEEEQLVSVIADWIETYGRTWIEEFTGGENSVNCPDGTLTPSDVDRHTPTTAMLDRWYCKITGKTCPIQGRIPLENKESFINGCNVEIAAEKLSKSPEAYKEGLFKAVRRGDFTGEHHQLAREGCWHCQQERIAEDLYLPWELTTLYDHIGDGSLERKMTFRRAGLESWIGHPICAECFISLPEIFPDIDFDNWGLELDLYRKIPYKLDFD